MTFQLNRDVSAVRCIQEDRFMVVILTTGHLQWSIIDTMTLTTILWSLPVYHVYKDIPYHRSLRLFELPLKALTLFNEKLRRPKEFFNLKSSRMS